MTACRARTTARRSVVLFRREPGSLAQPAHGYQPTASAALPRFPAPAECAALPEQLQQPWPQSPGPCVLDPREPASPVGVTPPVVCPRRLAPVFVTPSTAGFESVRSGLP